MSLKPYTKYTVRLAAANAEGLGQFSEINNIRTQGIRKCYTLTTHYHTTNYTLKPAHLHVALMCCVFRLSSECVNVHIFDVKDVYCAWVRSKILPSLIVLFISYPNISMTLSSLTDDTM